MVKRTQILCQQKPKNCLSVFDHFVGLALKGLNLIHLDITHPRKVRISYFEKTANFNIIVSLRKVFNCLSFETYANGEIKVV